MLNEVFFCVVSIFSNNTIHNLREATKILSSHLYDYHYVQKHLKYTSSVSYNISMLHDLILIKCTFPDYISANCNFTCYIYIYIGLYFLRLRKMPSLMRYYRLFVNNRCRNILNVYDILYKPNYLATILIFFYTSCCCIFEWLLQLQ